MADAEKLRDMVQSKSVAAERWERRPSMAMEESDLDRDEVRRTVQQAKESGRFAFANDIAILQALAVYSAKGLPRRRMCCLRKTPRSVTPKLGFG